MNKMANRLSKDQLENDQLVTSYYLFMTWVKNNQAVIYGGFIGLILLIGGVIWYVNNAAANEVAAREAITFAENEFMDGNYETALYGDEETMQPGLAEITSRYPRTTAGNLAFYYAAVSEVNLDNYESALSYIENFKSIKGVMGVAPFNLQGVILMQLERYEEAYKVFEKAANWHTNSFTTPYNLMLAAEAAHAAGNNRKANELVEKIKNDYPQSDQITQAERLSGVLSAS